MTKKKATKKKKDKLSRDEQNKQAFRVVTIAMEKVKNPDDRDRILEAVGCLLGSR